MGELPSSVHEWDRHGLAKESVGSPNLLYSSRVSTSFKRRPSGDHQIEDVYQKRNTVIPMPLELYR